MAFLTAPRPRLLLLSAALLALAACGKRENAVEEGIRTQTLRVGNAAEPADLDPNVIYAYTDTQIVYTLFEALTVLDAKNDSKPRPAACTGWDVSPDGRVYTFHLRPEARWSNGDPVTAADWVYSAHRILSPAFAATYSYMLWPIVNAEAFNSGKLTDFSQVGVKALDRYTLQYTLTQPTPYFPALVSHQTYEPIPQRVVEKFGRMDQKGTRWTRAGNLVGNGAFRLVEWATDSRVIVERNPHYWDDAHTRLHRVEFYPIEKYDIEELKYRSGGLHATYSMPTNKFEEYRKNGQLKIDPVLGAFYLFVNCKKPPFDNVKVRQALAKAMNRAQIFDDITHGLYPPAYCMTPPDCGGYTSRAHVRESYDEARKLLAEAGYPDGKGLPAVEIICYESEVPQKALEAIQAEWRKELHIDVTIAQQEQKTLFANEQQGNYRIGYSGWQADYADPLTFLETMETDNGNNWTFWSNKEYDRLIEETRRTADNARRLELFQQAEAILVDQAPLLPMNYRPNIYARRPEVKGWTTTIVGFHEFSKIWLER